MTYGVTVHFNERLIGRLRVNPLKLKSFTDKLLLHATEINYSLTNCYAFIPEDRRGNRYLLSYDHRSGMSLAILVRERMLITVFTHDMYLTA